MRRLANRQTFPFPDSPEGCPFNPLLMAYARLQPVSGSDDESFLTWAIRDHHSPFHHLPYLLGSLLNTQ